MEADVENYVVETDYNDYAILVLLSTSRVTGNTSKIVKLYSESQKHSQHKMNHTAHQRGI